VAEIRVAAERKTEIKAIVGYGLIRLANQIKPAKKCFRGAINAYHRISKDCNVCHLSNEVRRRVSEERIGGFITFNQNRHQTSSASHHFIHAHVTA
jgi:hypothetical protein